MKLITIFVIIYIYSVNFLQYQKGIVGNTVSIGISKCVKAHNKRNLQEKSRDACDEEKRKINLEKQKVEKSLQECTTISKKELEIQRDILKGMEEKKNSCIAKNATLEIKLKECNEQKGSKGRSGSSSEMSDDERVDLLNKIKKLEDKLKERVNDNGGVKGTDNYLISYEKFKNYIFKICKIYKTLYIVLIDMNAITNLREKTEAYKKVVIQKIKLSGHVVHEKWKTSINFILANNNTKKVLMTMQKIRNNKYVILIKNNANEFGSGVKEPLYNLYINLKPKLALMKSHVEKNLNFFLNRLQRNSEALITYLYTTNPEIRGIIPVKLHDQIILLIFLTCVNLFILYIIFYFFFVIFRFIKAVLCFFLRTIWCIVSCVLKFIFFVITLPIRPFMKKKEHKQRKVYKSNRENGYNAPERNPYQHSEFKKSNKEHYVKHRR